MKLQTKVFSVLTPLALASAALILFLARESINTILIEGVARRGVLELADISPKIAAGMRTREEKTLLPLLNTALEELRASYAMALDSSGTVLAHTNVMEKGRIYGDPLTRRALGLDQPAWQAIDFQGKKTLDVAVPVWAGDDDFLLSHEKGGKTRLGTLRLGLPLEAALTTRTRILGRITLILLLTGGITSILILAFLRGMLRPVRLLAESAGKIGRGQYGVSVPALSRDELGELARSFNRMSADLAETTVSKEYLDGVIRSIGDILIVTDSRGYIRTINPTALAMLGYSEDELSGRPASCLFESRQEDVLKNLDPGSPTHAGSTRDLELNLLTKAGKKLPALLSGSVLRNRDGHCEGLVMVAKDITERQKLELMVRQAEKLSAVGQLAAGVAHEFNNPLGIIIGFAQSALKRIDADGVLALPLKSIIRESLRCEELVRNLLVFSRTQRTEQREDVDINSTLESAVSLIQAQSKMGNVEIVQEPGGGLPKINADKTQIQKVIIHLAANAIDAMPKGGTLTFRTALSQKRPGHLEIQVQDTGCGIPQEIQGKIFDPFFTTKDVGKGTGLGLALVYETVKKHEGAIEFETAQGKGATFTVYLPLAPRTAGEA